MKFKLVSKYKPAGDQPEAIAKLVDGISCDMRRQTLLGVTGSGKTFTVANVIEKTQKPTLVIAHNKTLAAQLCNEFREFFPNNAVEYFVSFYDYYQPEAYMPHTDTYIEKEAQINEEIDRLRHACTQALLTRKDVIIVASVSAIYNLGSPKEYERTILHLEVGQKLDRRGLMEKLVEMKFERTNGELKRGTFLLRGQVLELVPVNEEKIYRFGLSDKIDSIEIFDALTRKRIGESPDMWLFPAKHYVVSQETKNNALQAIRDELKVRYDELMRHGKLLEAERLKRKTNYDLELIEHIGYCNGIENYSRFFEERKAGEPAFTLLDYFHYGAGDFLTVIDESHVTIPQLRGMFAGDRSRKDTLIEHGFRLPSARDNRPLTYEEFDERTKQVIYVSATPDDYEMKLSDQVVEQIVRPTGLIDPEVIIAPVTGKVGVKSQIEDLLVRIEERIKNNERTLVTTLTKKMAEDLSEYLKEKKIKVTYLHSDIETLERIQIITDLRKGKTDVLVGVNLLREGLDMPEVSLVAILDADKEGFLRSSTSLIQTIGRAARNANGQVVLYADNITGSIQKAIDETARRREIQLAYNKKHGITPKTIEKTIKNILADFGLTLNEEKQKGKLRNKAKKLSVTDLDLIGDGRPLEVIIKEKEKLMREAAEHLEFELAAILRDEVRELKGRKADK
ncbi:MAG TPA: excinuclease ABC subunit UvrB [Candidatus Magasanikbacteria bacterium]|nr:excinuclease ABC subunit UvrB [Candidatus Magasanikbacteria bacterium]